MNNSYGKKLEKDDGINEDKVKPEASDKTVFIPLIFVVMLICLAERQMALEVLLALIDKMSIHRLQTLKLLVYG